jgi:hypothetical protein
VTGDPTAVEDRVRGVLAVAAACRSGVPIEELCTLLPEPGPGSPAELASYLAARPGLGRVDGGMVYAPGMQTPASESEERSRRGERFLEAAGDLLAGPWSSFAPWLESLCITGSAAFGRPERGDDLDLLAITRPGALWSFLAAVYLSGRVAPRPHDGPRPIEPCFNRVYDAVEARREFARARGFVFAREALRARPILGAAPYRQLLAGAPWMAEEIPRQYASAASVGTPARKPVPAPWAIRWLSAVIFPWLAAYLQLRGLQRSAGFRRAGREGSFRTETRWRAMTFSSDRFERFRAILEGPATDRRSTGPPVARRRRRLDAARGAGGAGRGPRGARP